MITTDEKKTEELIRFIDESKQQDRGESYLIAVLHKAQELYGYLSREVMDVVAERMNIPTSRIWGVATFYHYFNLTPPGKHVVSVCLGTACYVKGAGAILEAIKQHLEIEEGQTTEDGLFSLQPARCLGACGLAPVVMIDDKVYGDLTQKKMVDILRQYKKDAKK